MKLKMLRKNTFLDSNSSKASCHWKDFVVFEQKRFKKKTKWTVNQDTPLLVYDFKVPPCTLSSSLGQQNDLMKACKITGAF